MPERSPYSVHPAMAYVQSILANLESTTGKSLDALGAPSAGQGAPGGDAAARVAEGPRPRQYPGGAGLE